MDEARDAGGRPSRAREAALFALRAVDEGLDPKRALDRALSQDGLPAPDRALATALVYGVTRERARLDDRIARFARRPVARLDPTTRAILRMAAFQLLSLERVPAHAAVNEAVELAKRHAPAGAAGFVNAVLRRLAREAATGAAPARRPQPDDPVEELARRYAFPPWIVARWLFRYGRAETEALLAAFDRPPGITLRVNRLRATVADVIASLAEDGVAAEPGRLFPDACVRVARPGRLDRLAAFRLGWVSVQDESSLLAVRLLLPSPPGGPPPAFVVDVAAAPGGKALALAEALAGQGRVLANDRDRGRAEAIARDAKRLGLANVTVRVGDARRLPEAFAGSADRVLADVPCSGLGVVHRRADLRWRRRPADIPRLARLAFAIARSAARLLRPGGVLVYSTCTTEPEENEGVVARLLAAEPDLALDDLRPHLPAPLAAEPSARHGWIQCLPNRHGVDGFFAARLVRRGPAAAGP